MRVVHISDTHLGRGAFQRVDPDTGINKREQTIYDNFLASVDTIIRSRPDLLIHTGDLFDVVKPKNKAIVVAMEGFRRLSDADIPIVIIAGNHSMVKTRSTVSPYELFKYSHPGITCVYRFEYEQIDINDVAIHAIPNMLHTTDYADEYQKIQPDHVKFNILMMHGLAPGINQRLNTFAEMEISADMIHNPDIQYIALGHYHGQMALDLHKKAVYSGSLEYLTYGERFDEKGGIELNTDTGSVNHIDLPHNPMIPYDTIDCRDMTASDITNRICALLENVPDQRRDTMVHITLDAILPEQFSTIDFQSVNESGSDLLNFHIKKNARSLSTSVPIAYRDISTIQYTDEFTTYIQGLDLTDRERTGVETLGLALIRGAL